MRQIMTRFTAEADEQGWRIDDEIARNLPALETLSKLKPELLHRYLKTEHPQVAATLLALVPPELSAEVLDMFDPEERNELVLRVALLDRVNPNTLGELNEVLERALAPDNLAQLTGVGGVRPVVEILNNFSGDLDKQALATIRQHDARLADDIASKLFTFEDFALIDATELQKLLPKIPLDTLAVALKGAPPSLRDLFVANMTKTMSSNLRVQMDGLPPVRVQEVQLQQKAVVRTARQLADQNELSLDRSGASGASTLV
jgi:flagellar motor switch protein FliG